MQVHTWQKEKALFIVFPGTTTKSDWLTNIKAWAMPAGMAWTGSEEVHRWGPFLVLSGRY